MHDGFQANPEGLIQKGKNVTAIYDGYLEQKGNVDKTTDRIEREWVGADSTGCITAIRGYDEDFKKLGEVLERIGDIIYRHGMRLAESRDTIKQAATKI